MAIERTEPKNPGPHGACEDCRTGPCECPPDPPARPSRKMIGKPFSITVTPEQLAWLQAQRAPGEPTTAVVRRCIQAIMDGAVQPCYSGHCYRRKK